MRFIKKVKDFFQYEVPYGVRNLISWFPIIWKDRNWDYWFIYVILRHKLHLMEQNIRRYGHHTTSDKDADKIKVCVLLLDRLINDDYHENVYYQYYKRWGHPEMVFQEFTKNSKLGELLFRYPNVKNEEDDKLRHAQYLSKGQLSEALKKQDLDLLFKIMNKHIQTWWD